MITWRWSNLSRSILWNKRNDGERVTLALRIDFPWNSKSERLEWQNRSEGTNLTSRRSEPLRRARFVTGKFYQSYKPYQSPPPQIRREKISSVLSYRVRSGAMIRPESVAFARFVHHQAPVQADGRTDHESWRAAIARTNRRRPYVAWHSAQPIAVFFSFFWQLRQIGKLHVQWLRDVRSCIYVPHTHSSCDFMVCIMM